jgi:hypothetical protein
LAHVLSPCLPYLIRRWRESGANSRQLWREIQALGYSHSARTVWRFITRLRRAGEAGGSPELESSPYTHPQGPSARAVSFVMICTHIARAYAMIQAFLAIVRERRGNTLEAWMAKATRSGIEVLARFGRGLQRILQAA